MGTRQLGNEEICGELWVGQMTEEGVPLQQAVWKKHLILNFLIAMLKMF